MRSNRAVHEAAFIQTRCLRLSSLNSKTNWCCFLIASLTILVIDPMLKSCIVVEVTVCFDLYFGYAFDCKCERYTRHFVTSFEKGIGTLRWWFCVLDVLRKIKDVWRGMRALSIGKVAAKRLLHGLVFAFEHHYGELHLETQR